MPTVLVTAATGTVGRHVVRELADIGVRVRVGSRDPAAARDRFESVGEVVEFDFARPETWGGALDSAPSVFLVRPPGVSVDRMREFVDALARLGAPQVAYLSTLGADRNPLIPHYRIERHLEAAAVPQTFLSAAFFCQNLHEVHGRDIRERDEIFVPAGDGRTSFVDARDVGAVGATVLAADGHERASYDVTGPAALTYEEVASVFSEELGRDIRYAEPGAIEFVRRMRRYGHPLGYALLMFGIYTTARLGLAGRVSDDAERVLGRELRTVREYVADYRDEFAP
jgi:uncharacterized protein YbjT (DUF2867 family)